MYHPLSIKLATVGQFRFRQSIEGLLKMFVTQPDLHWRNRKGSGRFPVATTSVLTGFTQVPFLACYFTHGDGML